MRVSTSVPNCLLLFGVVLLGATFSEGVIDTVFDVLSSSASSFPDSELVTQTYVGNSERHLSVPACPTTWDGVCGTDGITYKNLCWLRFARLKNYQLIVSNRGNCTKDSKKTSDIVPEDAHGCLLNQYWEPVCANDDNTYPSTEAVLCINVMVRSALKVVRDGLC